MNPKISKPFKWAVAMLLANAVPIPAQAFVHPGLPTTLTELDNIKAQVNANVEPWKSSYTALAAEAHSQLSAGYYGPFQQVGRTPDVNQAQYISDMQVVYNHALMWRLTGNAAYATKAIGILDGYATTHTIWSGAESYLSAADVLTYIAVGADLLRTSSSWTPTIETHVKNYFANMFWPQSNIPNQLRSAGQGACEMSIGIAAAVFCDDTARFAKCLDAFRNEPCTGLNVIWSSGQFGDAGRDQGHALGELSNYTLIAEIAWKQGVDLYSEKNNAILRALEYYSKYNLGLGQTYTQAGPCYYLTSTMGGSPNMGTSPDAHFRAYNHYVARKGLSAPYITQWLNTATTLASGAIPWKLTSAAQPAGPPPAAAPGTFFAPSAVTTLTNSTLGTVNVAGSATYSGGTWTVKGSGTSMMASADSGNFAYKQMTGNGTIIARITSQTTPGPNSLAGIMMRDSLATNANAVALWAQSASPSIQASARVASFTRTGNQTTGGGATLTPPYWLKIVRNGSQFLTSSSLDGVTWSPLNDQGLGGNVPMGSTIYVGFVVCSASANSLSTATFTNLAIDTTGGTFKNGSYKMVNRNSGKALDVSGGGTADNTAVVQYPYNGGLNQLWSLTDLGNGRYRIIGVGSNKSLTVSGNSTSDGLPVVSYTYNPTADNQRWWMGAVSGYNTINVDRGNKTIQVRSSSDIIEQGTYNGSNGQQWSLTVP